MRGGVAGRIGRVTGRSGPRLADGSRVAVVGGGPAGALCATFLLQFANRIDLDLEVDVYEPRDFGKRGPAACNMCGGIVSESLVQHMAIEGLEPPPSVVQRGLEAYVLHTEAGTCRIQTPVGEKRIATVHRGGGPRTAVDSRWSSFDGFLLDLAVRQGARHRPQRVNGLSWEGGRPQVECRGGEPEVYDLLVGALGVNSKQLELFEGLGFGYVRPETVTTYITDLDLGSAAVEEWFGDSMHVFLLDLPRLDFAALIPKGEYVTLCLLGAGIDRELMDAFFEHPQVRARFPAGWERPADACRCGPRMFYSPAAVPFTDRVVMVGDCGVSRLFKDGIGAAYRAAKAASRTAVFAGIAAEDFRRHYAPVCRTVARDNLLGKLVFRIVHQIQRRPATCLALLRMVEAEKRRPGPRRVTSSVLWDTFTGSASYSQILGRMLRPAFGIRFALAHLPFGAGATRRGPDGVAAGAS